MTEFEKFKPQTFNISQINGGNKYKNGDGIGAEAINAPIEASAYVQELAINQPIVDNGGGETFVSIEDSGNGTPRFVFHNLVTATITVDKSLNKESDNAVANSAVAKKFDIVEKTTERLNSSINELKSDKVDKETLSEYALKTDLPKKTSELENDSEFVTKEELPSQVETDTFYIDLASPNKEEERLGEVWENDKKAQYLSSLIENAYNSKPQNAERASIVFYNSFTIDPFYNPYEFLSYISKVTFQSNCDYYFESNVQYLDRLYLKGISSCNFKWIKIEGGNDISGGTPILEIENCQDLNFENCLFVSDFGAKNKITNSKNIYFENCFTSAFSVYYPSVNFGWVMFENCIFRYSGYAIVDNNGSSKNGLLVVVSNCYNEQTKKISSIDVSIPFSKVSITATEDDIPIVPTSVSELKNDTGYITKKDIPTIPTKTSQLTNDSDFATMQEVAKRFNFCGTVATPDRLPSAKDANNGDVYKVEYAYAFATGVETPNGTLFVFEDGVWLPFSGDLSDYVTKNTLTPYATKEYVDEKSSKVYRYCGSVYNYGALPTSGQQVGDTYNVENEYAGHQAGTNFAWNGTTWDALGGWVDLSVFVKKTDYATHTTNGIMLASDKAKLDSVETGANNYSLPTATGARLGGVIVGKNLKINDAGVMDADYPQASTTNEGLMSTNDKYYLTWLYANLGKSYHAFGDVAWRPVEGASVMASVTYIRTGKGVGLLNISLTLNSVMQQPIEGISGGWLVDITKVENLLSTAMNETIRFKRGVEGDTSTYYSSIGGTWVRQKEEIQTTHHAKARVCGISPFVIIPMRYSASATSETGISLGTVNASAFEPNETIQMLNIPVEEV